MARVIIDLGKLAEECGLPCTESMAPDGVHVMRDYEWNADALAAVAAKAKEAAKQYDEIQFEGHTPTWVVAAGAYAGQPATTIGFIVQENKEFPIPGYKQGEVPEGNPLKFEIDDRGDILVIKFAEAHPAAIGAPRNFDVEEFHNTIVPAVPAGRHIVLDGFCINVMGTALALAYAKDAASVSMQFHGETGYTCCATNSADRKLGDVTYL